MRPTVLVTLALSLAAGAALAQTSTSPGSPGSPGGAAASKGAPALQPNISGPSTPSRSNTEVFPPSRLLPQTQGSTNPSGGPGGSPGLPTPSTGTQGNPTGTQGNPTSPLTSDPGGQPAGGGTSGQTNPLGPNSQTSSGSANGAKASVQTGKNPVGDTIADCMKLWEPATHMTKAEWTRTCRRVQSRLDQVAK